MARSCKEKPKLDAKDARIRELEGEIAILHAQIAFYQAQIPIPRYIGPNYPNYPVPPPATYQPFPQWHTTAHRTNGQG